MEINKRISSECAWAGHWELQVSGCKLPHKDREGGGNSVVNKSGSQRTRHHRKFSLVIGPVQRTNELTLRSSTQIQEELS